MFRSRYTIRNEKDQIKRHYAENENIKGVATTSDNMKNADEAENLLEEYKFLKLIQKQ